MHGIFASQNPVDAFQKCSLGIRAGLSFIAKPTNLPGKLLHISPSVKCAANCFTYDEEENASLNFVLFSLPKVWELAELVLLLKGQRRTAFPSRSSALFPNRFICSWIRDCYTLLLIFLRGQEGRSVKLHSCSSKGELYFFPKRHSSTILCNGSSAWNCDVWLCRIFFLFCNEDYHFWPNASLSFWNFSRSKSIVHSINLENDHFPPVTFAVTIFFCTHTSSFIFMG